MRKTLAVFAMFALSLVAARGLLQPVVAHAQQQPKPVAFTLEMTNLHFSSVFEGTKVSEYVTAYRGDGSVATVSRRMPALPRAEVPPYSRPEAWAMWMVVDLATNRRLELFSGVQAFVAAPFPTDAAAQYRGMLPRCASEGEPDGEVLGYAVRKVTYATDSHILKQWLAPDLNCAALRMDITSTQPSGNWWRHTREATRITLGEPDPAPFMTPAGWQSVSYVELNALFVAKYGTGYMDDAAAARFDRQRLGH